MAKDPVRVLVTVVAGQIGYAIVPMIARGAMLGPDQPVILHMLDIEPAAEALNGVRMELIDAAFPLLKGVVATTNAEEACKGVNIAVMVGGFPRKEGMERKDVMSKNVSIYKAQASALEKHAAEDCKVLVVANPANTNALILKKFAPSIPEKNITCLTRLDHNRALGQISERINVHVGDVKNVIIWGNHSSTQYPDVNHATVATSSGEKNVRELVADDNWLNSEFITMVQQRGAAIIKARKLSSALSAASSACDHIRDWVLGTPKGKWVSMGVYSDGSYGIQPGLIYSFPVTCEKGEWSIVQGLKIDEFSRAKLDATEQELIEEKALAYSWERDLVSGAYLVDFVLVTEYIRSLLHIEKEPLRVLVTGKIGYAIVPMIAKGDMLGPGQPVILRMLDIEPVAEALKGVRMELIDAAFPLFKDVFATTNAEEACKGVNIAAMVGGFPRKEGSGDCEPSKHQCTHLERICTFNPREKHYMSYPTRSQQALGQISERLNVDVVDVKNVIAWGNHSSTQYPDVNHATVTTSSGEKSVRELAADDNWLNSEFITTVQQCSSAIIKARKLSSALSAANFACDHIRDWVLGTPKGKWVSMGVYSDGSYGIQPGLISSFPVTCDKGEWSIVQGLRIDEFSRS
ncbi:hypothetical protein FEM48_Zijuj08G0060600 [Ziziphus jujuba var. spinosa]|uniref:malate dehydrogenase n=1 Tax=Ziziphus jujuba var. spinosa TaxID=714518 RepID=A0A978UXE4_ZIZJJ|nr:hypothetical protein FEM48_Zijuj08G0060600 [Ziziphus jujuba var. spinosa]